MDTIPDGIAIIRGTELLGSYMEYYQNNDFMYFSGVEIPNAILIIDGIRKESLLFFTISESSARNEGIPFDLVRNLREVTGIERVLPLESFSSVLNSLSSQVSVFYTSFKPEELMRECTNEKFRARQRDMTLNEWDGRIAVNAHIEMMKATRPGMYEYELAALYEYSCKKEGAQNLAYYAIICSGPNHPYLHYDKHNRLLQDGDFLVIDVGPDVGYYDIDIMVLYPVNGKFTPRQKEVLEAANAVHEANLKVYHPGLTFEQCREEVAEILKKQGFDLSMEISDNTDDSAV